MLKQLIYGILFSLLLLTGINPLHAEETRKDTPTKAKELSEAEQRKFDYFFFEGLNLKTAGKFDAAFDAFNHCMAIDSTASPVLYELSSFYVQMNRPEKAVEMLQRAVANSTNNFTYRMALATISRNLGMYGEAAEEYEKLVKAFPRKTGTELLPGRSTDTGRRNRQGNRCLQRPRIVHRHERGALHAEIQALQPAGTTVAAFNE